MTKSAALLALVSVVVPAVARSGSPAQAAPRARSVAFTFDDLPAARLTSLPDAEAMTAQLLDALDQHAIPAIGFVNESKLDAVPGEERARAALLASWLDAGHELGNHTYSHLRLYGATLDAFQADVLRGERVTRALMADRGRAPRFFRHPTLNTGRDAATRDSVERFLSAHGYAVAPVTIDSDEYLYGAAYDRARGRGDSARMRRLGTDYVRYLEAMFAHFERLSVSLVGREIAQVLLLHASWLNADYLPALAAMARARGYGFVSLDRALNDEAYRLPDRYVGSRGPSWLERWAISRGQTPESPPAVPGWVREP
jgi:peptidoglycan/xylan/chitin deacetylase (PgdA/CDA1 family)